MSIERPMNEYELALFSAVMTLTKAVVALGANRAELAASFREFASQAKDQKQEDGAAVSGFLADLAERDVFYIPKPPFTVLAGGKDHSSN